MACAPPTAYTSSTPSSAQAASTVRVRPAASSWLRRGGHRDPTDPGDLGRHHVHHHAGRVGGEPARDVQPDPAHRHPALQDGAAWDDLGDPLGRDLRAVADAHPGDRLEQRRANLDGQPGLRRDQLVLGHAQHRRPHAVETLRGIQDRGRPAPAHVLDQVRHLVHRAADVHDGPGQDLRRVTETLAQVDSAQHATSSCAIRIPGGRPAAGCRVQPKVNRQRECPSPGPAREPSGSARRRPGSPRRPRRPRRPIQGQPAGGLKSDAGPAGGCTRADGLGGVRQVKLSSSTRSRPGGQRLLQLREGIHFDFERHVGPSRADRRDRSGHRTGSRDVVVLDERGVAQTHPVVKPTAAADGVLLQRAQPRQRLAGVPDPGLRAVHGAHPPAGRAWRCRKVGQQVQRGAFRGQQRPGRPRTTDADRRAQPGPSFAHVPAGPVDPYPARPGSAREDGLENRNAQRPPASTPAGARGDRGAARACSPTVASVVTSSPPPQVLGQARSARPLRPSSARGRPLPWRPERGSTRCRSRPLGTASTRRTAALGRREHEGVDAAAVIGPAPARSPRRRRLHGRRTGPPKRSAAPRHAAPSPGRAAIRVGVDHGQSGDVAAPALGALRRRRQHHRRRDPADSRPPGWRGRAAPEPPQGRRTRPPCGRQPPSDEASRPIPATALSSAC